MKRLIIMVGKEIFCGKWKETIEEEKEIKIFLDEHPDISEDEISKTSIESK